MAQPPIQNASGVSESASELSILFTDLVGSTRLYEQRGNAAAKMLVDTHIELLSAEVSRFGGKVVKTIGDSILATFAKPRKALGCAVAMQKRLQEYNRAAPPADRLTIRIGVHHGTAIVGERDVHGNAVNLAARIEEKASGEEILTSQETWEKVSGLEAEAERLGDIELKGIAQKVPLVKVLWDPGQLGARKAKQLDDELIPELASQIAQKRCVLVVGGLVSSSRTGTIAKRIARKLSSELGVEDPRGSLLETSALFEEENGREDLLSVVTGELRRTAEEEIPPLLATLARLPFDLVLTTEIDDQLERALAAAGKRVKKLAGIREARLSEVAADEVALVKLFGDLEQPGQLVLTVRDARARWQQWRLAPEELQGEMATRHALLVGFPWSDRELKQLYDGLRDSFERPFKKSTGICGKVSANARSSWAKRGLNLVEADETPFFERLHKAIQPLQGEQAHPAQRSSPGLDSIQGRRPYKFLSYFTEEDELIFFGRESDSRRLFGLVAAHRLVLLHAPSGTGKSSLLNAGLVPRLRREGYEVASVRLLREPEWMLRQAVAQLIPRNGPNQAGAAQLLTQSFQDFPHFLANALPLVGKPVVLVLDQFEEFFLRFPRKLRQGFARELAGVLEDPALPVRFVLSLRDDFHGKLAELKPAIPDVYTNSYGLEPLGPAGMEAAIAEPARLAGIYYEEGLVGEIIAELGGVGAEAPHLQILCDCLYEELREGEHQITRAQYQRLGGASGILGSYLGRFLESKPESEGTLLKEVLKSLVTSVGTKGVVSADEMARELKRPLKEAQQALDTLLEARLVRALSGQEVVYELSHEVLIDEIGRWVDERARELKKARELLQHEVLNHRKYGLLMDGSRIAIVNAQAGALTLSDEERALLKKSIAHVRAKWAWGALTALALVAGAVFGVVQLNLLQHTRRCENAIDRLAGAWDPQVKAKLRGAFLATKRIYAADTFQRFERALDAYTTDWVKMATDNCLATRVQGTQSPEVMDLRMGCLDDKLGKLQALTEVYAEGVSDTALGEAVKSALELDDLLSCADVKILRSSPQPPENLVVRNQVTELDRKLHRVEALERAGRYQEGLPLASQTEIDARQTGFLPVQASATFWLAYLQELTGDLNNAESTLSKAIRLSAEAKQFLTLSRAWNRLIFIVGFQKARIEEALAMRPAAEVALLLADRNPSLEGVFLNNSAILFDTKGDSERAVHLYQRAIAVVEKNRGSETLLSKIFNNLAATYDTLGDYGKAEILYERAIALRERILGSNHPQQVIPMSNLAFLYINRGEDAKAERLSEKALALAEQLNGPDHPDVAYPLDNLCWISLNRHELEKAAKCFRRDLDIRERSFGESCLRNVPSLSGLSWTKLRQRFIPEAIRLVERALSICEKTGCSGDEAFGHATAKLGLATALWESKGNLASTRRLCREAREVLKLLPGIPAKKYLAEAEELARKIGDK